MMNEIFPTWTSMNDRLTSFVQSKVQNEDLAKDIVQDVFVKVFTKSDTIRDKTKLVSWIYQITRNEIISHFRKNNFDELFQDTEDGPDENEDLTAELAQCIYPLMEEIPDKYKQALLLADIKNVSQKELAMQLDISYSGAKSRVQRGREMKKANYLRCCQITTDVYGGVVDCQPKPGSKNFLGDNP